MSLLPSRIPTKPSSGGNLTAKYIIATADAKLPNAQVLGSLATGIVKNTTTTGVLSIATSADYVVPTGALAGQTLIGGTATTTSLTFVSNTSHDGKLVFGNAATSVYDEANDRWGFRRSAPDCMVAMGLTNLGGAGLWGTSAQFIQIGTDTSVRGGLTVGQSTSNNISFYWTPNVTGSSATAYIESTGFNNPLKINARNIYLHPDSPAFCNVLIGTGSDVQNAKVTLTKTSTHTSGTERAVYSAGSFTVASGSGVYNHLEHNYTIAQTSTASGNVTGFLLNATETGVLGTHTLMDLQVAGVSMFKVDNKGGFQCASAALATNATVGIPRLRTMAGTPTGAVADGSIVIDTTALKIWARMGAAWKQTAALT